MASFNRTRAAVFDAIERRQHYRDHVLGLSAYQRHKKFVSDYLRAYGEAPPGGGGLRQEGFKSDRDSLREEHRFIRSEEDDAPDTWAVKLARKYYDKLFREYAVADLSRFKEGRIGLRWRTQPEVVTGKGQFICGAKGCSETDDLASYEVNFMYEEAGEQKQALVKLRICPSCAKKLNSKREKQYKKVQRVLKRIREKDDEGHVGSKKNKGEGRNHRGRDHPGSEGPTDSSDSSGQEEAGREEGDLSILKAAGRASVDPAAHCDTGESKDQYTSGASVKHSRHRSRNHSGKHRRRREKHKRSEQDGRLECNSNGSRQDRVLNEDEYFDGLFP